MIPRGVRRAALSWLPLVLAGCNLIFSYHEAARETEVGAVDARRDGPHVERGVADAPVAERPDIGPFSDSMTGVPDSGKPDAPGTCEVGGKQGTWICQPGALASCEGRCTTATNPTLVVRCKPPLVPGGPGQLATCTCPGGSPGEFLALVNPLDPCETCRAALPQCLQRDGGPGH
jgi:hypothetical protein